MTPLERELLETAWPYIWTGMLGVAGIFIRAQAKRLDAICAALKAFQEDVVRIEKAMAEDRAANRHRIDVLIGASDARISRIEAVCDSQHATGQNRRATDRANIHWAQTSDVQGSSRG